MRIFWKKFGTNLEMIYENFTTYFSKFDVSFENFREYHFKKFFLIFCRGIENIFWNFRKILGINRKYFRDIKTECTGFLKKFWGLEILGTF